MLNCFQVADSFYLIDQWQSVGILRGMTTLTKTKGEENHPEIEETSAGMKELVEDPGKTENATNDTETNIP